MTELRILARSLLSSWAGYASNVLIIFILSPIIVGALGPEVYGIWVLVSVLTGYLGLIETGVTVSTGRFINYHLGRDDRARASEALNTSFAMYVAVGCVILLLILVFRAEIESWAAVQYGVSPETMFAIVLLLAANVVLGFLTAVMAQILYAANRFDLTNLANFVALLLRFTLTLLLLNEGGGILALAWVQCLSTLVAGIMLIWFALGYGPTFEFGIRMVSRRAIAELLGFGKWAFVNNIASRIVTQGDVVVVGTLLKAQSIGHYSIAQMLVEYAFVLMRNVVSVGAPDIVKRAGQGDLEAVRRFMVEGSHASAFFGIPVFVGLIAFGGDFLYLWMGEAFATASDVVVILAVARLTCTVWQSVGTSLWALGQVKLLAVSSVLTTVCNVILSVLFVVLFDLGLEGVAYGTLVPMVLQQSVFLPYLASRVISVRMTELYALLLPRFLLTTVVFYIICWQVREWAPIEDWSQFIATVVCVSVAYVPIGALLLFGRRRSVELAKRILLKAGR